MSGLLLPATDGGVAAQLALLVVATAVALRLSWARPDVRLLVAGVALTLLGLIGVRAAH